MLHNAGWYAEYVKHRGMVTELTHEEWEELGGLLRKMDELEKMGVGAEFWEGIYVDLQGVTENGGLEKRGVVQEPWEESQ